LQIIIIVTKVKKYGVRPQNKLKIAKFAVKTFKLSQ
jgi:hypothetical protein